MWSFFAIRRVVNVVIAPNAILVNSATISEVLPERTFRGGLNVWTAGVGGNDSGGWSVWLEGQEEGREGKEREG